MKAMWKPRLMWRHWLFGMNCGASRSVDAFARDEARATFMFDVTDVRARDRAQKLMLGSFDVVAEFRHVDQGAAELHERLALAGGEVDAPPPVHAQVRDAAAIEPDVQAEPRARGQLHSPARRSTATARPSTRPPACAPWRTGST